MGRGWGEGDDTGWLIHLIWLMTMRTGAYKSNDKQTLLGPQDMTITHVKMRRLLGPTATFQNLFPTFPPAAPFSSKSMRYILEQWRRRKKIVLMIAELAQEIFYQCFFFFGVTLSKLQHICQRKRTHITYDICQLQFLLAPCQLPIHQPQQSTMQAHRKWANFLKRSFNSFLILLNCFFNPRLWYTLLHWPLPQRKKQNGGSKKKDVGPSAFNC
jgi:hypothetical protein